MILLPLISLIGVYTIIYAKSNHNINRIDSMIYSTVINVVYCFLSAEVLSVAHTLTRRSIEACWILAVIAIFICCVVEFKKGVIKINDALIVSRPQSIIGVVNVLIVVVVGMLAIFTIPYNWDSMSYHLTRIVHWILNRSVAHYACFDYSQITDPNLAEFIDLHIYLLTSSSDRLLNIVQFGAYSVSAILVGDICKKIGGDLRTRDLSVLCFLTTPIVFAEATTTQVDLVSAMFLLIFVYFAIDFIEIDKLKLNKYSVIKLIVMGTAAGLTYDAKAHSCIAIVFFAIWIVVCCIRKKDKIADILVSTVLVIVPAVIVVLPELIRNIVTFGTFAADEVSANFVITSLDPRYYIINFVDNVAFNLNNRLFFVTEFLLKVTQKLRLILFGTLTPAGVNGFYFAVKPEDYNIDCAINPLAMWLFVLLVIALLVHIVVGLVKKNLRLRFKDKDGYIIVVVIAMVIFLAIARWYRYITRYEVGYFAILFPAVMMYVKRLGELFESLKINRGSAVTEGVRAICVFLCIITATSLVRYFIPYAIPLDKPYGEYFRHHDGLYEDYYDMAEYINAEGYKDIGFMCGNDSYEYPLYKMIEDTAVSFQHVNVNNETAKYEDIDYKPDCIVVVDTEVGEEIECNGSVYHAEYILDNIGLFGKE